MNSDAHATSASDKRTTHVTEQVYGIENAHENLGDDFADSPWLQPDIEKLNDFRKSQIYKGGEGSLRFLNITSALDLGIGVPLYFQFLKTMAVAFGLMFLFSLPSLVLSYYGSRIPVEDQDYGGLYKYSIGNIGYDPLDPNFTNNSVCENAVSTLNSHLLYVQTGPNSTTSNVTCIHIMDLEMTLLDVSTLLTVFEVLQVLIFFIAVIHLHRRVKSFERKIKGKGCYLSNYSVVVHNIPVDTTESELIQHFSSLYPLDRVDWRKRDPLRNADPVTSVQNTSDEKYLNTWVAECSVHGKMSHFMSAFRKKQKLMEDLYRCRAEIKMYGEDSPFGPNIKRSQAADRRLVWRGKQLDNITEKLLVTPAAKWDTRKVVPFDRMSVHSASGGNSAHSLPSHSTKSPVASREEDEESGDGLVYMFNENDDENAIQMINNQSTRATTPGAPVETNVYNDAITAFVVFEYAESFARCIEDYQKYSRFPYNFFYPEKLRFRDKRLQVEQAPDPADIIWENLELSWFYRWIRRVRTHFVAFVLVMICFAVVLQASIYQSKYSASKPQPALCDSEIPALYMNSYTDVTSNMVLTRPAEVDGIRSRADASCEDIEPDSFYATYTYDGNVSRTIGRYSLSSCTTELGLCPQPGISSNPRCPCVSTTSNTVCKTLACTTGDIHHVCKEFPAADVGGCFCQHKLIDILDSSDSLSSTMEELNEEMASGAVCRTKFIELSLATSLAYVAIAAIILINMLIRSAISYLSRLDGYSSIEQEKESLLFKLFITLYINLAVVVVVAFGKLNEVPSVMQENVPEEVSENIPSFFYTIKNVIDSVEIFQGPYDDFTVSWYGVVGTILIGSMIIQALMPLLYILINYSIINPIKRNIFFPGIIYGASVRYPMQYDYDKLGIGPPFDVTVHSAHVLACLFFGMTFASGLPIMTFLIFLTFTSFFVTDRMLLYRYYQMPYRFGVRQLKLIVRILPLAAIIRLSIGCWMYSSGDFLAGYLTVYNQPDPNSDYYDPIQKRLYQNNVLPLFVLIVIIFLVKLWRRTWHILPIYWVLQCCKGMYYALGCVEDIIILDDDGFMHPWDVQRSFDPLRQEVAPFTGDYYRLVRDDDAPDTCLSSWCCCCEDSVMEGSEEELGWRIVETLERHEAKIKVFEKNTRVNGEKRYAGDAKRTYEVIRDDFGICSYALDRIPAFKLPIPSAAVMEYHHRTYVKNKLVDGEHPATIGDVFFTVAYEGESIVENHVQKKADDADKRRELVHGLRSMFDRGYIESQKGGGSVGVSVSTKEILQKTFGPDVYMDRPPSRDSRPPSRDVNRATSIKNSARSNLSSRNSSAGQRRNNSSVAPTPALPSDGDSPIHVVSINDTPSYDETKSDGHLEEIGMLNCNNIEEQRFADNQRDVLTNNDGSGMLDGISNMTKKQSGASLKSTKSSIFVRMGDEEIASFSDNEVHMDSPQNNAPLKLISPSGKSVKTSPMSKSAVSSGDEDPNMPKRPLGLSKKASYLSLNHLKSNHGLDVNA